MEVYLDPQVNHTLTMLDLHGNKLGPKGAAVIGDALKVATLLRSE